MCDSHIIFFSVEHINTDCVLNPGWPGRRGQTVDIQDGEVFLGRGKHLQGISPLTGAKFQIRPVFKDYLGRPAELIGYEVSINTPACMVGNNALMDILVYLALVSSRDLLRYYLLTVGCNFRLVKQISLKHAELRSVTFTYLLSFNNFDQATNANAAMEDIAESFVNAKHPKLNVNAPATAVSSRGSTTVKLKLGRRYEITSYVKKGRTKYSYNRFASQEVERAIFAESSRHLRVEISLKSKWLKDHNLVAPEAWRNKSASARHYENGMSIIRHELGLDRNLRMRRPKPANMTVLSPAAQKVLKWHLRGKDYRKHPAFARAKKQYPSKIKREIERILRIDMSIPWRKSHKSTAQLDNCLVWESAFVPPSNLVPHCFVRETVCERIRDLQTMVKNLAKHHRASETTMRATKAVQVSGKPKGKTTW